MALPKPKPLPVMRYRAVATGEEFRLVHLKLRENENNTGKLITRPIYTFSYLNRAGKPNFTSYIEEIDKQVRFLRWVSIV